MIFGPLTNIDKQEALGILRLAGGDRNRAEVAKRGLLFASQFPKWLGTIFMIVGVIATVTVVGAPIGIPMFFFGWWIRRRGINSIAAVEAADAELAASL